MELEKIEVRPHEKAAYLVTGNSGKLYTVSVNGASGLWYCTCEAFKYSHRFPVEKSNNTSLCDRKPCKHVLFAYQCNEAAQVMDISVTITEIATGAKKTISFKAPKESTRELYDAINALQLVGYGGR